jgi:GDP-4-dehydro-6-deoxy-D-mannose reductase
VRILVTGAEGFVGRHLLRTLARDGGHEVVAGYWAGGEPAAHGPAAAVAQVPIDVTSSDSLESVIDRHGPDWVIHLAAQSSVSRSFADPVGTWEVNATGTLRLAEALRSRRSGPVRLLVISSAEVYGEVPREAQPIPEQAPLRPSTPYGASKAAAELAALQAAEDDALEVVIARSFNHAGPGQDERFVFPSMARQLMRIRRGDAEPVLRVGNLEVFRDFLDVRDVVRAYLLLMRRGENRGVYNVCSGVSRSLLEMVTRLVALSDTGARLEVDPERFRPVDIPVLYGDASRLRALGWKPEIELEQTLRDLLAEAELTTTAEVG